MGTNGTITDVTNAIIRQRTTQITGVVASTPALLVTDGKNTQYACDVQISMVTSDGVLNQIQLDLYGVVGGMDFKESDTTTIGTILRNVPIANNNGSMQYAAIGMGVQLTRVSSGQWEITGFTQQLPGTRFRYGVNLASMVIGEIVDLSLTVRPLTLGEVGTLGGFGQVPLGARGVFVGGKFQRITF